MSTSQAIRDLARAELETLWEMLDRTGSLPADAGARTMICVAISSAYFAGARHALESRDPVRVAMSPEAAADPPAGFKSVDQGPALEIIRGY